MLNPSTLPGPGDAATWPAYAGDPRDPRWDKREITDADVSLLAYDLSLEPNSISDALSLIADPYWVEISTAIAQRDADALLRACVEATAPVLRDIARGRLEASS